MREAASWNKHPLREATLVAPACYHTIHKPHVLTDPNAGWLLQAPVRALAFQKSPYFLPCIESCVISQLLLNVSRTIVTIISTPVTALNVFVLM